MKPSLLKYQQKMEEYEKRVVNFFIENGKNKNTSPTFSSVFGYLFTRKELTQKQLQELTGFSAGTISQVLSQLLALGMLSKYNIPGTHEKLYKVIELGPMLVNSSSSLINSRIRKMRTLMKNLDDSLRDLNDRIEHIEERGGNEARLEIIKHSIPERMQRLQILVEDFSPIIPILKQLAKKITSEMLKVGT